MAYKLIGVDGNEIDQGDLQNKGLWCKIGATKEETFVEKFGRSLQLAINPEKETNPYAPDLIKLETGNLADLKTQNTPFFQARSRFGLDPQYTVVFNSKDFDRYQKLYPNIEIYFAVDWQAVKFIGRTSISVEPMNGVWHIEFLKLSSLIEKAPFHSYKQRTNDRLGNAKGSYVLDISDPAFSKVA